jgi:hypothetical protein
VTREVVGVFDTAFSCAASPVINICQIMGEISGKKSHHIVNSLNSSKYISFIISPAST